ncbi:MAG: AraC family transcriptional regulator [Myxococcales bacterium]|nr:AraC family transcriptional regulator [Myxococcales bacterium]
MDTAPLAAEIGVVAPRDGVFAGPLPGTLCLRRSAPSSLENRRWRASLALVASGVKELVLGGRTHALAPGDYTLTPVTLPLTSRFASATRDEPFLALLVEIDPVALSGVVAELDSAKGAPAGPLRSVFAGRLTAPMLDAAARLMRSFASPEAARVLGPGCVRELMYRVLCGPNGPAIRRFVQADSAAYRVARAVYRIEASLADELNITALASEAGMSRTVFFEQFKRATALSPVQYQKRLRLIRAQRLMVDDGATAEGAAYEVGYRSASQFSREYARMFGEPPFANATRLRRDEAREAAGARPTSGGRPRR